MLNLESMSPVGHGKTLTLKDVLRQSYRSLRHELAPCLEIWKSGKYIYFVVCVQTAPLQRDYNL